MRIAPRSTAFTIVLGLFAGLPALSIDLSAPTLVDLPKALGTTTTVAGLTLSLFMLGFAIGQLVSGRVSDLYGRRPVLLGALLLYVLAGVACALATSGPGLAVGRLVQGAGAGGCAVLAYAIVQDLFEGEAARSRRSYVTVVLGITPVLAPALGAWLGATFGWRSVHSVLVIAGVLLLAISASALEETRPGRRGRLRRESGRLRDDRRFVGIAIMNGLSYGAVFAYVVGAPVIVMARMGYTAGAYAVLFAASAIALSAGAWTSGRLGRQGLDASRLAWPGLLGQSLTCVVLALYCGRPEPPRAEILAALILIASFARGIIAPNLIHLAIGGRRTDAGFASAMIGVIQLLLGALSSALVAALLPSFGFASVATPMAVFAGSAALLWLVLNRRRRRTVPRPADGP